MDNNVYNIKIIAGNKTKLARAKMFYQIIATSNSNAITRVVSKLNLDRRLIKQITWSGRSCVIELE